MHFGKLKIAIDTTVRKVDLAFNTAPLVHRQIVDDMEIGRRKFIQVGVADHQVSSDNDCAEPDSPCAGWWIVLRIECGTRDSEILKNTAVQ